MCFGFNFQKYFVLEIECFWRFYTRYLLLTFRHNEHVNEELHVSGKQSQYTEHVYRNLKFVGILFFRPKLNLNNSIPF